MLLQYYLEQLDYKNMPLFLRKYFECPSLRVCKEICVNEISP